MAAKSYVRPKHGDHKHCAVCGYCLTTGVGVHPCRPQPIDPEVLEVVSAFIHPVRTPKSAKRSAEYQEKGILNEGRN